MESLLTSSESHAFQSFLTSINDGSQDWNIDIDVPKDRQALAKATKDLMALDTSLWPPSSAVHQHHPDNLLPFLSRIPAGPPAHLSVHLPHPTSDSSSRTPTPTSSTTSGFSYSQSSHRLPSPKSKRTLDSPAPVNTQQKRARTNPYSISPTSPHGPNQPQRRSYSHSQAHPSSSSSAHPNAHPHSPLSASPTSAHPHPHLPNPHLPISHLSDPHLHPQPQQPQPQHQPKLALLSPSQKKANHIQSEQKRRANIRRGYEALCECVPALREAIREEEAAAAAVEAGHGGDGSGGFSVKAQGQQGKGKRGKARGARGGDGEDKVDGRAGPRSENVVLSKTIDYINDLLDERSTLLARLHCARSTFPPGHPALTPASAGVSRNMDVGGELDQSQGQDGGTGKWQEEEEGPLWEREWKGGHGRFGDLDDDGDGEGEVEEESC